MLKILRKSILFVLEQKFLEKGKFCHRFYRNEILHHLLLYCQLTRYIPVYFFLLARHYLCIVWDQVMKIPTKKIIFNLDNNL
jgi:hypothetical protein